ncbi:MULTISPECIES: hypothetical protein [Chromatiaceae]|uniref:Uncharacterized protein n=1 Tax=Lamprobacter modestohalophilus TaxID=1064514 RepID=A0A9X1B3A4_9GAMM|nr:MULTISPECIES: hypothetical protein [Chromatiaceae]MBK1617446.1 hypothetical protein [Lamprobacter modestohalophilus]MBK5940341.1 hypothetical protein [Halochromatium roseum]
MNRLAAQAKALLEAGPKSERPDARFTLWAAGITNDGDPCRAALAPAARAAVLVAKSIGHCDVKLGPLTYLVGGNGAGNSNAKDVLERAGLCPPRIRAHPAVVCCI